MKFWGEPKEIKMPALQIRFKSKSKRFAGGKRIYLRRVRISDVDGDYYQWMNDPEVTRFMISRFTTHTKKSLKDYVRKILDDPQYSFFAIVLKDSNRHIGNIKVGPFEKNGAVFVGIMIGDKNCWNRGYATEAIQLVSRHAFEEMKIRELKAGCLLPNVGSINAFKKAGYSEKRFYENREIVDGKPEGSVVLQLKKENLIYR